MENYRITSELFALQLLKNHQLIVDPRAQIQNVVPATGTDQRRAKLMLCQPSQPLVQVSLKDFIAQWSGASAGIFDRSRVHGRHPSAQRKRITTKLHLSDSKIH